MEARREGGRKRGGRGGGDWWVVPAVSMYGAGGAQQSSGAPAGWPPSAAAQMGNEKGELLLTPSMAAKSPKGFAYVPANEYGHVVQAGPIPHLWLSP